MGGRGVISNIRMRNVRTPIFVRLGNPAAGGIRPSRTAAKCDDFEY